MAFSIIGFAWNKKNNIIQLAKKEKDVWCMACCFGGKSSFVFIKGRQNCKDYIQQLKTELLPYGSDWGGENCIHQQDGAFIHTPQRI